MPGSAAEAFIEHRAAAQSAGVQKRRRLLWILLAFLLLVTAFSLLAGRYPSARLITPQTLADDPLASRLVWNLRLPRIITAVLLGMSLSAAGTIFQMLFGNPLVEPGFLGVSQGAAFGAALCIVFFGSAVWLVQGFAAFFAVAGLGLSYLLARRVRYGGWVLRLVLSGIAVSALFSAGVGVLKYLADPLSQLPEITFWLLGGLANIQWGKALAVIPLAAGGLLISLAMRWRLNLLSLGDTAAHSLGASVGRERALLLAAAVLPTAAVISAAGIVGWVGLIMPHIARRIFGADA
ncbi:MAG: iron ABC transporter permease, partial [Anaerolineaceae bacterium]